MARTKKSVRASLARLSRSRFSFTRKADDEIFSEDARKIIDPRSISLRAIMKLRDDVLSGEAAEGVDLYVAKRDLSKKVKEGATIQVLRAKSDGTMQGRVPYVDQPITFQPGRDADPKPRADWTTEDVAEHVVLALTLNLPEPQLYLSLVDAGDVGQEFQGTFVSQARRCRFQDLVAALEEHFGQDADSAFVWLDLFCANQPLLTNADEALSPEVILARNQYLTHGLHRAIGKFGSAVIFFDRWDTPAPLQRAWCVWEIMGAISFAQNFEVVFAPGQDEAFVEALLESAEQMAKVLADNNDMRGAKCWKKEDKEMIDSAVASTVEGGYVTLIAEVNQRVRAWRLQMARDAATQARKGDLAGLAEILDRTGELLISQGEYQEALPMLEEALSIRKESLGDQYPDVVTTLNLIAGVYVKRGRYEEALAYYEEAMSILKEHLGDRPSELAAMLNNIATVHLAQGNYKEALAYFEEALSICRESPGRQRQLMAATLTNISLVYHSQGRIEEALAYYEEALMSRKKIFGDRHPDVAQILNNIAGVYDSQGRYEEALAYFEEALSIRKESLGDWHPQVAITLNNIAGVYKSQGRFEEALTYFEEALSIRKESLGVWHPKVAITLNNIALVYESQGRYEEALVYYEEALSIHRKSSDGRHPNVAITLSNIGRVYNSQGRAEEALAYLEEALSIRKEKLGDRHPQVVAIRNTIDATRKRMQANKKRSSRGQVVVVSLGSELWELSRR